MMYTDDPNHIFHRKIPECVCTQQPVKEGIEGENPSPCSRDTFFFYTVRTSFWKAKEIRIRDKNMPIRHHYCTLLYLFVERVYVSFGVNRSFSTTWPTISMARCGTTGYYGRSMLDWHGQTRNYGPECRVTFLEWATESNPAGEPTRRENFRLVRLTLVLAIAFSCRT